MPPPRASSPSEVVDVTSCYAQTVQQESINQADSKPSVSHPVMNDELNSHNSGTLLASVVSVADSCETLQPQTLDVSRARFNIEQGPNDLAKYCAVRLSRHHINSLLLGGPCQPSESFDFPKTHGRAFQSTWFFRTVPGSATRQRRNWLSYSMTTDKCYCLTCLLFAGPAGSDVWTTGGWNDWSNGSRVLQQHETSKDHRAADIARMQWSTGSTAEKLASRLSRREVETNRHVVSCIVDCLKYLASEMIAIRGHNTGSGKLYNLFELISKYDSYAASYLQNVQAHQESGRKMARNFLSSRHVTALLSTMRQLICGQVVTKIRQQEACSLISDGTYDSSKKEAKVVVVRYIEFDPVDEPCIVERLVDVFTSGDSSGASLCEHIVASLEELGIDIQWLVGQSYDGAGNVRGNCAGLKSRILQINPKAQYVWCYGHRLNLVVEKAASCCTEIRNALGLLEELYVFFSGH